MFASKDYGTLEASVGTQRSSKRAVMLVAGVIACAVIGTVTFSAGYAQMNSTMNANVGRAQVSPIEFAVGEQFEAMCANPEDRFVATAVLDGTLMVAATGKSTSMWEADMENFMRTLAESEKVSTNNVAFGMVNLPVYASAEMTSFKTYPVFVTYVGDSHGSEDFVAGSFLGGALLEAKCAYDMVVLKEGASYVDLCKRTKVPDYQCELIKSVNCPFGNSAENPCFQNSCAGVSSFATNGALPEPCCDDIKEWCADESAEGCSGYAYELIVEDHCDFQSEKPEAITYFLEDLKAMYPVPEPEVVEVDEEEEEQ